MRKNKRVIKRDDTRQLMRLNRILSNKYSIMVIVAAIDIFLFLAFNYVINIICNAFLALMEHERFSCGPENVFPDFTMISTTSLHVLYKLFLVVMAILDLVIVYRIRTSYSEKDININQVGDNSRWTTLEEIKQQYKEVPEKGERYPGKHGTIVSRSGDKIYIDTDPVNNLYIGITRIGKGEEHVFPNIDVASRAELQPSLVLGDPKLELYKSSKTRLESLGYLVFLFNLDDPLHSMGYNPLALCLEAYKQKNYGEAELLIKTFTYSIFDPDETDGDTKFFNQTASALLSALILAQMEDSIKKDQKRCENYSEKRNYFDSLDEETQSAFRKHFWSRYEETEDRRTDIVNAKFIKAIPPEYQFDVGHYTKQVNMYSIVIMMSELATVHINQYDTLLDLYFQQRPMNDRAKLKYVSSRIAGDRTKGSIYSTMLSKLEVFTYENIAKMTAESTLNFRDIGFGEKPIALFIGTPYYDKSTHFLASVLIQQITLVLTKNATRNPSGKCNRHVTFQIDEFGNMPKIWNLDNVMTACLGQGYSFNLFIQSYRQPFKIYGDDANTILQNCSNQFYIMAGDDDTAELYSKSFGSQTIVNLHRSGEKLELEKNFTEVPEEKRLLTANQLMRLPENSCILRRLTKRTDLEGNSIEQFPIYNSPARKTPMKRRYQYLLDYFPNPGEIDMNEINTESREHIILEERIFDFWESIPEEILHALNLTKHVGNNSVKKKKRPIAADNTLAAVLDQKWDTLHSSLTKLLGDNYEQNYGITKYISLKTFYEILEKTNLTDVQKKALISITKKKGVHE